MLKSGNLRRLHVFSFVGVFYYQNKYNYYFKVNHIYKNKNKKKIK